jgi:hypothetical protein
VDDGFAVKPLCRRAPVDPATNEGQDGHEPFSR